MNERTQSSVSTGNQIAISGEQRVVQDLSTRIQEMIRKLEQEIQEEKTITEVTVPNMMDFQIKYLSLIGFFKEMAEKYQLKSFSGDASKQCVTMKGRPTSIQSVQKLMFDLLPKVNQSKVSTTKTVHFLKVFTTASAEQTIRQQFEVKQIVALWSLEKKTISVYSESKSVSQNAIDCINTVVWESQYPADNKFDEQEKKVLDSDAWTKKKEELEAQNESLEIVELEDKSALIIAGLMQVKVVVIEGINMFFSQNVQRTGKFNGVADRFSFLYKWKRFIFNDLESKHNVRINFQEGDAAIGITGTKDDLANCSRSLQTIHDSVCKEIHIINNQAGIHLVEDDPEFLEHVGLKTNCLVVQHKEEATEASEEDSEDIGTKYSLTLPSGAVCEVRKDDITVLGCDAIVNTANGDLQHVGGLALHVIKKGT